MTCPASKSIWSVVSLSSRNRVDMVCEMCCVFVLVESLLSRYMSSSYWGMGMMKSGWLFVVGFDCARLALCGWMSPIGMRAFWSPYFSV
jgi:hypothetical protein